MTANTVQTSRPTTAPADAIRRELAHIRENAVYLRAFSRDAAESESATAIIRRTKTIESLLTEIGART